MFVAPTWRVDENELRRTLDTLRDALSRPIGVSGSALGHDRQQIASSLRSILACLDRTDLVATRAVPDFVREFRPTAQVEQLRDLFHALRVGWRQHVTRILGADKLLAAKRLLASPSPDVLRILGREDDENSHSDLIAWLLTPKRAPIVAPLTLRRLVSVLDDSDQWNTRFDAAGGDLISVRREVQLGRELADSDDLCRIDILVCGPGFVLALENKVWSHEHSDQTTTYWSWLAPMACLKAGLFVSPGGMTASCPSFVPVSYMDLLSALLEAPASRTVTPTEEIVLASYLKTLARSILPVEMRAIVEAAHALEDK
jgi:hypothetical protein